MWSIFKKKEKQPLGEPVPDFSFLGCDMHSHFIPGIDDGAKTPEDSLELIRGMQARGYSKLITTPHVYGEFYNNSGNDILDHYIVLKELLAYNGIAMSLDVAAEYFLDQHFMNVILPGGLLTFGGARKYVLVEVSMMGWPRVFDEIIFAIQAQGYSPVLAHPERYTYEGDPSFFLRLKERNILMQLNLLAVSGYYGATIRERAFRYLDAGVYDFCGSDVHHLRHQQAMTRMIENQQDVVARLKDYPGFRNRELLNQ